jgi:hypothetical protein
MKDSFGVTTDGVLYASGARISGRITATSGEIGDFTLADGLLTATDNSSKLTNGIYAKGLVLNENAVAPFVNTYGQTTPTDEGVQF